MAASNEVGKHTTTALTEDTYSERVATEPPATGASGMKERRQLATAPAVMEDSGDDQSNTITLVTPRKDYVCSTPSHFLIPVQETSLSASAELVC